MPMFAPGQVERIEPSESWPTPCRVEVRGDSVERTSVAVPDALVVLSVPQKPLTEQALGQLTVTLGGIWAAFPEGVEPDATGCIEVPLLEPEIGVTAAAWRMEPGLMLVHEDSDSVGLYVNTDEPGRLPTARLDAAQCWTLLRALVSLLVWRERVREALHQAATACRVGARTELGERSEPPAVFAGEAVRRLTLNDSLQLPCSVSVSEGELDGAPLPGDQQVLEVELSWRWSSAERGSLGMLVSRVGTVLPTSWHVGGGVLEVPYVHPTSGDESGLVWRIAEDLSVVSGQSGRVWFTDGRVARDDGWDRKKGTFRRRFDAAGIRRLAQVMVSLMGWEDERDVLCEQVAGMRRLERVAMATIAVASGAPGSDRETARRERYKALAAEYRCNSDEVPEQLPQLVLVEGGEQHNAGFTWHDFGDDARELLRRGCESHAAAFWPPFLLVDLDSGEHFQVSWEEYWEPTAIKPGLQARVIFRGRLLTAHS